jgi:hypothetical protein
MPYGRKATGSPHKGLLLWHGCTNFAIVSGPDLASEVLRVRGSGSINGCSRAERIKHPPHLFPSSVASESKRFKFSSEKS